MDHGATSRGATSNTAQGGARSALAVRIETQTTYLVEMMRRLGVPDGEARKEADRAGLVGAMLACAECTQREACGRLLSRDEAFAAPPDFCPNRAFLQGCARALRPLRGHAPLRRSVLEPLPFRHSKAMR